MQQATPTAIFYFSLILVFLTYAQEVTGQSTFPACGADVVQKIADPTGGYSKVMNLKIQDQLEKNATSVAARSASVDRVVPIVVHSINPTGASLGIDDSRVDQAIANLNAAFSNQAPYDPTRGVNTNIQFCKAQRTPSGLPSTGLEEVSSALSDLTIENDDVPMKQLSRYEPRDYVNIYVVNSITSLSSGPGVAGYAFFPTSHGNVEDGIVLEASYFGNTAENDAVLVHEMGHYLGLYHTFQGGCANADCTTDGDRVCDTPPDNSTARIACTDVANTCNTDTQSGSTTDLPDDTHNYMDYTTLACMVQFTAGQSDRMNAVLDGVRASLLLSRGCVSPCTTPLVGSITLSPPPYVRGSTLTATATIPGAVSYDWTLNQVSVGATPSISFPLNATGLQRLRLEAVDQTGLCALVIDTTLFVRCELDASFDISPDTIGSGDTITLTAASTTATMFAYEVNGLSLGSNPVTTYTLPSSDGTYQFCLTVANMFCSIDSCITITIDDSGSGCVGCTEICDNGIDDDGDGYVDCYDVDCQCFDGEDCIIDTIPPLSFAARMGWNSKAPQGISATTTPIIANLDPQNGRVSEIVVHQDNGNGVYIFQGDGSDGLNPDFISTSPLSTYSSGSPGAADLDGDGIIELILPSRSAVEIYSNYQQGASPPMQFQSATVTRLGSAACFADFDGDGFSEIYGAQRLLHSPTRSVRDYQVLVPNTRNIRPGQNAIAADILRPIDCGGDPDCNGLEYISGSKIYSVDLSTTDGDGIEMKVQRDIESQLPQNNIIKYTSVADVDLDGVLDIIATYDGSSNIGVLVHDRNGIKWSYDGLPTVGFSNAGSASVTEVIDDTQQGFAQNYPEFIVVSGHRVTAFNLNQASRNTTSPFWWQQVVVDRSGITGVTSFDFNGDGLEEIVYHDEESLRIVYGGMAPYPADVDTERNYVVFNVGSLTADEIPLIADIDGDNEAEIITLGGINDRLTSNNASIVTIESDPTRGSPWTNTRNLWNQREYSHVNINDDLSVPQSQQLPQLEFPAPGSGRRPFNRYLVQQPIFDENFEPYIPVADVVVDFSDVSCSAVGYEVRFEVCNSGSRGLSYGTPIQVYGDNPTLVSAASVFTDTLPRNIEIDGCDTLTLLLPLSIQGEVFVMVNDNGSIPGPFSLDDDFPSTGVAECDYTNNIFPLILPARGSTSLDLGPDIAACATQPQILSVGGSWSEIRWSDGSTDSTFTAPDLGTYWVDVWNICGEKLTDTIRIIELVTESPDLGPDIRTCDGDTVQISALGFQQYSWREDNVEVGCDTCSSITVVIDREKEITLTTTTIDGCIDSDSLSVFAEAFPEINATTVIDSCSTGTGSITVTSDSLLNMSLNGNPLQLTNTLLSTDLSPGMYSIFYQNQFCALVDSIEVISTPAATLELPPDTLLCYWDTLSIQAPAASQYSWSSSLGSVCNDCQELSLFLNGDTQLSLTIVDSNNCSASDTLNITRSSEVGLSTMQPVCTPYTGGVAVFTADPVVEISFNGGTFQGSTTVSDLAPNTYGYTFTQEHCIITDSITLLPLDSIVVEESQEVCEFTSTEIAGVVYQGIGIAEEIIENPNGCDTLRRTYLEPAYDTSYTALDTTICSTDVLIYGNITLDEAGIYQLQSNSDKYCPTYDSLTLWMQAPPQVSPIQDTILNLGQEIQLSAFVDGKAIQSTRWEPQDMVSCPECLTTILFATRRADITLEAIDSLGCIGQEQFQLRIRKDVIDAPSAFSPNGDGTNDFFTGYFAGERGTIKKMLIFNRWGEQIFTQVNFPGNLDGVGWDGTQNGEKLNPGVFVYLIEYEAIGGRTGILKGDVTLTR